VVCITHSLANVEATCHLVVILTEGGRLACVGTPEEARAHFGIARLGDVYRLLAAQPGEHWQSRFAASPLFAKYVRNRLSTDPADSRPPAAPAPRNETRPSFARQTAILTRRYVAIWRGDILALATMLVQSLSVAVLMDIVYGNIQDIESPVERAVRMGSALFMLSVSSFWQGCNNAAKELVKDRVIHARERAINQRIDSYFASKALVLTAIGFLQVMILYGNARLFCGVTGPAGKQWMALCVLSIAGTCLGLAISALSPSEEVAVAMVPTVILPQFILAGTVAPLNGLSKVLAQSISTVYWAGETLQGLRPLADLKLIGKELPNFYRSLTVVVAHTVVFASVAVFMLWNAGRKKG